MTKPTLVAKSTAGSVYQSASAGHPMRRARTRALWWRRVGLTVAVVFLASMLFPELYERWNLLILSGLWACACLYCGNSGYARGWQAAFMEQRKPLVRGHRG